MLESCPTINGSPKVAAMTEPSTGPSSPQDEPAQGLPATVDAAVHALLALLPDKDKTDIAAKSQDELIELHFGLGMWIRNNFGLWQGNAALAQDAGTNEPDDIAGIIIEALWRRIVAELKRTDNLGTDRSAEVDAEHPAIVALAQYRDNMTAFTEHTHVVPIDHLVSTKDELHSKKPIDSRVAAAKFMVKSIVGNGPPREPLAVEKQAGGKYLILDGNATMQAAKLAGWTKLPIAEKTAAAPRPKKKLSPELQAFSDLAMAAMLKNLNRPGDH